MLLLLLLLSGVAVVMQKLLVDPSLCVLVGFIVDYPALLPCYRCDGVGVVALA